MAPAGTGMGASVVTTTTPPLDTAKLLDAALSYAALGRKVFPLQWPVADKCSCRRGDCTSPAKHPKTEHGLNDATINQETIREWWRDHPQANVGLRMGDGLIAIDVDPDKGGDESINDLGELPDTVTALTGGGGRHLVFHTDRDYPNGVGIAPGVDVRSRGGYIVAPPSRHVSGRSYEWETGLAPGEMGPAPLPDAFKKLMQNGHAPASEVGEQISDGQRNSTLASLAGTMRRRGMSEQAIAEALLVENEDRCKPPLPESEVRDIANSISRYPPADSPNVGPNPTSNNGEAPDDDVHGDGDRLLIDAGDGNLAHVAGVAWKAILAANDPPVLYRRGTVPAWIEPDDDGAPIIREVTPDRMRFRMARVADWYRDIDLRGGKQKRVPAFPPVSVVRDLLATPDPQLPVLTRIVEAPVYGPDGTLQSQPGYHTGSRTVYAPAAGFTVDDVPVGADVDAARALIINDLLGEFPFVSESELAHAVALMILPFVRDMITGPTPLHLIEKPTQGTGGSLLVDVLTLPALGRPATAMTEARDEDEWRKRITARLMAGPSIILIDNLHRRLESAALSAAVTAETWEDRILGRSETIRIPVRCVWVATGNNPALSSEMARRAVRIRLDAKMDRPWQRDGFRHPRLRLWANENRAAIVKAVLVVVNAWLAAGRPKGKASLGSFESWADIIGGILQVAGVPGFLGNLEDLYEHSDAESGAWRAFVYAWWDKHQDKEVGVAVLWDLIDKSDLLINLGTGSERSQKTRLGIALSTMRDRQFDDLRIVAGGTLRRAQQYQLAKTKYKERKQNERRS